MIRPTAKTSPWPVLGFFALVLAGILGVAMIGGSSVEPKAPEPAIEAPTIEPTSEPTSEAPRFNHAKATRLAPRLLKALTPWIKENNSPAANLLMREFTKQTGCGAAAEMFTSDDTALIWGNQATDNNSVVAHAWIDNPKNMNGIIPETHWSRAVGPINRVLLLVAVQCKEAA